MLTICFDPFPTLASDRLTLRCINENDAQALYSLRSDERVMEFLDRPRANSVDDALELIRGINLSLSTNQGITWGIALNNNPRLIGTIGYWRIMKEHFRAEIGYLLHPDMQGKGIMQEAITKIIDYGFSVMGLHSVEANVNPGNRSSIKLLERNHFIREAYLKENYYFEGKFLDSLIYSRLTPSTLM